MSDLKKKMVKIELRKFGFIDYIRMLNLTLKPDTAKELEKSFFGYVISGIKGLFDRTPRYKFAIIMNGKFVGSIGIYKERGYYEVGYYILPEYRRKGIATIAVRKLLNYASHKPDINIIRAETEINNIPSLNVLKKNKFRMIRKDKKSKYLVFEKRVR